MKAFILCAGLGTRLRPYTHSIPKTSMPFLNLPLLCYNWFYLEKLRVKNFYLNSHLFPETLKQLTEDLKKEEQKIKQVFESHSLDSAGGLYNRAEDLKSEPSFFYMNGDSLFFPSCLSLLSDFKNSLLQDSLGTFFTVPFPKNEKISGAFWVDKEGIIQSIGDTSPAPSLKPVKFVGLAHFSSDIFKSIDSTSKHIFHDVMIPLLKTKKFKAFVDEEGFIFEGGSEKGLLEATETSLQYLFSSSSTPLKEILLEIFKRFDPKDEKVGIHQGKEWQKNNKSFLLYPKEIQKENLEIEGFAVLGKDIHVEPQSFFKKSILSGKLNWRGSLENKIVIKF